MSAYTIDTLDVVATIKYRQIECAFTQIEQIRLTQNCVIRKPSYVPDLVAASRFMIL